MEKQAAKTEQGLRKGLFNNIRIQLQDAMVKVGCRRSMRVRAYRIAAASGDFAEIVVSCMASHRSRSSKTGAAWGLRSSARQSGGEPRASFSTA